MTAWDEAMAKIRELEAENDTLRAEAVEARGLELKNARLEREVAELRRREAGLIEKLVEGARIIEQDRGTRSREEALITGLLWLRTLQAKA